MTKVLILKNQNNSRERAGYVSGKGQRRNSVSSIKCNFITGNYGVQILEKFINPIDKRTLRLRSDESSITHERLSVIDYNTIFSKSFSEINGHNDNLEKSVLNSAA